MTQDILIFQAKESNNGLFSNKLTPIKKENSGTPAVLVIHVVRTNRCRRKEWNHYPKPN